MSKLYRTTYTIEILSNTELGDYELSYLLDADICDLRVSVATKSTKQEVVSPERMRTLLEEQRSDPNLFGGEE